MLASAVALDRACRESFPAKKCGSLALALS